MKNLEQEIHLKPLTDNDVDIFSKWLDKEYIHKWFCPENDAKKEDWLDEINDRSGEHNFIRHFIVYFGGEKIGFCQYYDCYHVKDELGIICEKNHTFGIDFLIGETEYLGKGIGKLIIKKLEEKIAEVGGQEIFADPGIGNMLSVKTLLSNGFVRISDEDYRKKINLIL